MKNLTLLQNSDMRVETHSPLDSSFICKMSWFEDGNILMLTFATGSIWAYYDIPYEVYTGFCKAKSYGKYFNANIRNVYFAERISYVDANKIEV